MAGRRSEHLRPGPRGGGVLVRSFPNDWIPNIDDAAEIHVSGNELGIRIPAESTHDLWTGTLFAPNRPGGPRPGLLDGGRVPERSTRPTNSRAHRRAGLPELPPLRHGVAEVGGFPDGVLKISVECAERRRPDPSRAINVPGDARVLRMTQHRRRLESGVLPGRHHLDRGRLLPPGLARHPRRSHGRRRTDAGRDPGPGFISRVDYVFNTATPIVPEDGIPDDVPLEISDIEVIPGEIQTIVKWRTNRLASGQVDFGLTNGYELGSTSPTSVDFVHERLITGLTAGTPYHFRIRATDLRPDNATSADDSFQTLASGVGDTLISLFSGLNQTFGFLGQPQRWVNIRGNAVDIDGIDHAFYTVNGGSARAVVGCHRSSPRRRG
ncbi:MAG: fibronectin type III domain-containing protein [Ilumatobacteraceae bacterium]